MGTTSLGLGLGVKQEMPWFLWSLQPLSPSFIQGPSPPRPACIPGSRSFYLLMVVTGQQNKQRERQGDVGALGDVLLRESSLKSQMEPVTWQPAPMPTSKPQSPRIPRKEVSRSTKLTLNGSLGGTCPGPPAELVTRREGTKRSCPTSLPRTVPPAPHPGLWGFPIREQWTQALCPHFWGGPG